MTPVLPWPLYVALGFMAFAAMYNMASWNAVRYYMQCTCPEQAPRVVMLMKVNRITALCGVFFGAFSMTMNDSLLGFVMTALIATPIVLLNVLFYMIFTMLHDKVRVDANG